MSADDCFREPLRIEISPKVYAYTGKVLYRLWPDGSLQVGTYLEMPDSTPGPWMNTLADKLRELLKDDVEWIPLEMPDGVDPIAIVKYPMARGLKVMDAVLGHWVFRVDMRIKEAA